MNEEKIKKSQEALSLAAEMSEHYYHKPVVVCYSGGKDSDVILSLAIDTLKPNQFRVLHAVTTLDSPITNKHVNRVYAELKERGIQADKHIPDINMWDLIVKKKTPPTRIARYCCKTLKEVSTPNQVAILGVRGGESTKRRGRDVFGVRGGIPGS